MTEAIVIHRRVSVFVSARTVYRFVSNCARCTAGMRVVGLDAMRGRFGG